MRQNDGRHIEEAEMLRVVFYVQGKYILYKQCAQLRPSYGRVVH